MSVHARVDFVFASHAGHYYDGSALGSQQISMHAGGFNSDRRTEDILSARAHAQSSSKVMINFYFMYVRSFNIYDYGGFMYICVYTIANYVVYIKRQMSNLRLM